MAVDDVTFTIEAGETYGLLGPNGAGKTTTISMIAGVITPTRGRVEIDGLDLAAQPRAARARLGLVPQDLAIYEELTAQENLRYVGALYGLRGEALATQLAWALAAVGLGERAREPVRRFSGGMKRRLNLAMGLLHRPPLVILDEPTVGVDPQSRNHIFETVRRLHRDGMTIVYTSHYMEEVEALCDRVAIIDGGRVVALGPIAELVAAHAGDGVELELTGDADVLARAATAAAAHGAVHRDGRIVRVVPAAGLAPVIAALEGAGATIARIESRQANLETAFLALTGRALRDAA